MKSDFIGIGAALKAIGWAIFLLVFFLFVVGIAMGLMAYHIVDEHINHNDNKAVEAPVKTGPSPPKVKPPPVRPKEVEFPSDGPSDGSEINLPIPPLSKGEEQEVPVIRPQIVR